MLLRAVAIQYTPRPQHVERTIEKVLKGGTVLLLTLHGPEAAVLYQTTKPDDQVNDPDDQVINLMRGIPEA
jgi:hypothetical protein